jgi:hypothetical protein
MKHRIIAITGVDGSGKTTLVTWLQEELRRRGYNPAVTWSRFNNYLSLPFLALTRLTGHNYYEVNEGVRMGYHDFERLPVVFRVLFVILQAIDVNMATFFKIKLPSRKNALTICERGPWDTLVDVVGDTGFGRLLERPFPGLFFGQVAAASRIIFIDRDPGLIEAARSELKHDRQLRQRHAAYRRLATSRGWTALDNNRSIADATADLSAWLDAAGYRGQEK